MFPARARMLLNMVLQTKYEAMQETVPSVPETTECSFKQEAETN